MPKQFGLILAPVILYLAVAAHSSAAQPQQIQPRPATLLSVESQRTLVTRYCSGCHNDKVRSGGVTLTDLDLAHVEQNAELAEKVIRKVRVGMMPYAGAPRPDAATLNAFAASLEAVIDLNAVGHARPGRRNFQRLTQTEYAASIRDLLGIDVDVTQFLPPDTVSNSFDNIADTQSFSPTLMEGYVRAAGRISRLALGDPKATPASTTYKIPRTASQLRHVEGTPVGTRGGIAVMHNFPADGQYIFNISFHFPPAGQLYDVRSRGEQIEIAINGEEVALLDINPAMKESDPAGLNLKTEPIAIKAGPQRVSAAFVETSSGTVDDILAPIEHTLAGWVQADVFPEFTTVPHLRDFNIKGPYSVTGVSETPSRKKIFKCLPASPKKELVCATEIVSNLARQAFRSPVSPEALEGLMTFYVEGRKQRDFESGIQKALQAILASPRFVFRLERPPLNVRPGQAYPISDLDLASRLSYFLWASIPDDALMTAASERRLHTPLELEKQVRRMLADPRAESLATKFAGQWLRLSDLHNIEPVASLYPQFDSTLADAMQRETELLFNSIVREDRNVLDLLTADYTFVNERLAKHYGIPNVVGNAFRRVKWADENRRGILGHGSILALTSIADRTSPVMRGKWVMEVLLGTPPPPPPPNVPTLNETESVADGKVLTVRERMELHRANPACNSCHRMIDPIGLALENFDVTGRWRIKDGGAPVDPTTQLYDGQKSDGPASLRKAILSYPDAVTRNFTEKLLMYSLGRRMQYTDMPAVRSIVRDAARNDYRFSSFILGIVKSPAFRMNTAEENPAGIGFQGEK